MAEKYPPYPAYQAVGSNWLDSIPIYWVERRLKHISPKIGVGLVINPSTYTRDEGVYFIFGSDVKERGFDLEGARRISQQDSDSLKSSRLNAGDLLSVRVGDPGVTAVVPPELEGANCASVVIIRQGNFDSDWLCFAMNSIMGRLQVGLASYGAAQKQFNVSDAVEFKFPVPPLEEQTQIAKFLDYETAKIDALIAKQQQLIALLQEKRQAVISHAVTKGLNPAAPLRDSGIAWLGQVPAHWKVSRLGYLAVVGNGSTPNRSIPEYWAENDAEGVGWLNSTKINDGKILAAEQFISQRAVRECHLPLCEPDSVLVAITGEGQTRGRAALLKISATINQHLAYLLPDRRRVDANFLWRQLQARYSWLRFESAGGGSTRAALTCEFLRGVPITLPPLVEQNEIVKWLDTELTRLDSIVDMAQLSMDLLQERRTALIAAAVTGKIDVRGWQPPVANAAAGFDEPHGAKATVLSNNAG